MKDRILVVDDDQDQCDLLAAALSRLGCDATTTTSTSDALSLIGSKTFSAILTDIGMSDMDGYVARAMKILDGNKSRAATLLGVDRRTLYRWLERDEGMARVAADHTSKRSLAAER